MVYSKPAEYFHVIPKVAPPLPVSSTRLMPYFVVYVRSLRINSTDVSTIVAEGGVRRRRAVGDTVEQVQGSSAPRHRRHHQVHAESAGLKRVHCCRLDTFRKSHTTDRDCSLNAETRIFSLVRGFPSIFTSDFRLVPRLKSLRTRSSLQNVQITKEP